MDIDDSIRQRRDEPRSEEGETEGPRPETGGLLQGLFDNMPSGCGIYEVRNDGSCGSDYIVKDFNPASLAMEGKTRDEVIGRSLLDLRPTIDEFGLIPVFQEVWRTGRPAIFPSAQYVDEDHANWYENRVFRLPTGEIVAIYDDVTERKRLEDELVRSKNLLTETEKMGKIGGWTFSPKTLSQTWTEETFRILEIDLTQGEPRVPEGLEFVAPASRQKAEQAVQRAIELGEPFDQEWEIVTAQGNTRWVHSVATIRWQEGEIGSISGSFQDITERKRAEETLHESKQLLERVMDAIPARVFWKDRELAYLGCNAAFARDAGFDDPAEMVGKDDYQMGWRAQADLYRSDDREVIESGRAKLLVEEPQTTPEGNTITLLTSKIPLRDSQGEISGVLGVYLDISSRKRAEEALRASEATMHYIIKHDPNAIAIFDRDLRYIAVSDRYLTDYDIDGENIVGKHHYEVFPEIPQKWRDVHQRVLAGAIEREEDDSFVRLDGSLNYNRWECRPWYEAGGSIGGIITYTEVTTERKLAEVALRQAEEQLHQSQKMEAVGQLAGGIAHDFNNLLTAILGYSDLLLASGSSTVDEVRPDLEEIKQAGERAKALTQQILAFSRRQALRPSVVSLNQVLAEMEPFLRRILGENMDLVSLPHPALGLVEVDVHQFEQVLMNLAVNARDAMASGGRLTLETGNVDLDAEYCLSHPGTMPGSYAMLAVSDTGTGMDEATLARIFEPFYTTKAPGQGTGLGLSTVYGIVKQSNGSIFAYSELGKGTVFKIYLPRVMTSAQAEGGPPINASLPLRGTETILLVEDEVALRTLATRILSQLGYDVLSAGTAGEALKVLADAGREIDLLLTDLVLPGGAQGRDLALQLLSTRPELPVLYMSGYTRNAIVHAGRLDEGVNFLEKPFTPEALARMVRQVLDQASVAG